MAKHLKGNAKSGIGVHVVLNPVFSKKNIDLVQKVAQNVNFKTGFRKPISGKWFPETHFRKLVPKRDFKTQNATVRFENMRFEKRVFCVSKRASR